MPERFLDEEGHLVAADHPNRRRYFELIHQVWLAKYKEVHWKSLVECKELKFGTIHCH